MRRVSTEERKTRLELATPTWQGRALPTELLPLVYRRWDLNPHARNGQGILSPSCLPFHHFGSQRTSLFLRLQKYIFFSILQTESFFFLAETIEHRPETENVERRTYSGLRSNNHLPIIKMHGRLSKAFRSSSKYFRHLLTDCVLSKAFSEVSPAAMQTRVAGCKTLQMESAIRRLR